MSCFLLPEGVKLLKLTVLPTAVYIEAASHRHESQCPCCQTRSSQVHSFYSRTVTDVPWLGRQVTVRLQTRKFRCANSHCPQKVFAERFPPYLRPWARKTTRAADLIRRFGLATGGRGAQRLAALVGVSVSDRTVLRLLMSEPDPPVPQVRVLGVDDFAFRRGQTYGTLLVDLEQHRVIDLLPDRSQLSFALWLRRHPEVRYISRDRGGDYAAAATFAAPQAEQIADRFHLQVNAGEVLERCLLRHHSSLRQAARALVPDEAPVRTTHRTPGEEHRTQERRGVRQERYEQVLVLAHQGVSSRQIARQLSMAKGTVLKYLHAEYFPELATRPRPRQIDPYVVYLQQRCNAGEHHVPTLWREIRAQGYPGVDVQIRRLVRGWRTPPPASGAPGRPLPAHSEVIYYSVHKTCWLLMKAPTDLSEAEAASVAMLKQLCPSLAQAQHLGTDFRRILTERSLDRLESWLERCALSSSSELVRFARGIRHDYAAVQAAVRYDWSQGPVEGHVNRLKLLKRQMDGRAGFDLLRRRVLAHPARAP